MPSDVAKPEKAPTPREAAHDILVVDDDSDLADSLAHLLRLEGHKVVTAYSAEAAIEILADHSVSVALVDIRLGRGSGVELIRHLRARQPELMAVVMTAYASVDTAVQSIQEGAYDYLCKPFFTEDLLATLERCFERRRLLKEREEAVAAVHARNRELKDLNDRLGRTLGSMQRLARSTSVRTLAARLLSEMADLLGANGGALYLRERERLHLMAAEGGAYPSSIALPAGGRMADGLIAGSWAALSREVGEAGPAGEEDTNRPPGMALFRLLDSQGVLLGLLALANDERRPPLRQDQELGQILISFGAEAIQAAKAIENLAESEERLSKIIENSPSAIALHDLGGHRLLANRRFDDWFGGDRLPLSANGEKADLECVGRPLALDGAAIEGGRAISQEVEVALTDGDHHSVLLTRFPVLDSTGRPVGVGTIGTDITEQRIAEQRLRQAQRMEAIGQLTGGIAHDFNNLLSVILGNLRLLKEQTKARPGLQELLEEALDATKAGAELTSRLLAFGRGQTLRPQLTDIRTLILDMSRMLERTLGEDIVIRLDLAADLWQAEIDRSQLESSVLNLAINARDAMPEGGELLIGARNATLGPEEIQRLPDASPGDYIALSVVDCGEGMTEEVLRKAAQPFFTTKEAGQGSGLGLSMVYGFVTQSKGHMELVSEVGRGTSVTLYFPALRPKREPHAATESQRPAGTGRGERVLVVEDHPGVRRLTRRLLTRLGYVVLEAPDAPSAFRILEEDKGVDVLVTDIVLPGGTNGVMLGRAAVAAHPELRVIYTTGYAADSPAIREHLEDTATILLRKPVQAEELSRALRAALES